MRRKTKPTLVLARETLSRLSLSQVRAAAYTTDPLETVPTTTVTRYVSVCAGNTRCGN